MVGSFIPTPTFLKNKHIEKKKGGGEVKLPFFEIFFYVCF